MTTCKIQNASDSDSEIVVENALLISDATATSKFRLLPYQEDIWFQNTRTDGDIHFAGLNAADLTGEINFRNTGIINFGSSGSERLLITSAGNVGIGTTAPNEKLDVNGTVNATAFSIGGTDITATAAELNYVDGVTSAIQTQIDAIGAPEGTAVLSTGESGGSKFLREDGDGTSSWQSVTAGAVDVLSNVATARIIGRTTAGSGDSEELTVSAVRTFLDIEAGADVTDTANVTSAGALMDSEVTNLAQVKAFDSSDYEPAKGTDDNYVTDAEKTVIGNTSGTNSGDQDLSGLVSKTGNETVAGVKTFSSSPIIPAPSTDLQAATKKYVDDNGGGFGISWSAVTANTTMAVGTGSLANKATLLTLTLPATSAVGETVRVAGMNAGLWKVAQAANQYIKFGNQNTTTGTGGSLASVSTYDAVELVCIEANVGWVVVSSQGNITVT